MKKLNLVVSLKGMNESYYAREQATVARRAAEQWGAQVEVLYAEGDPVLQSQQLLQRIQSRTTPRPDAILVEPVSQLGLPRVAEAAAAAGIAWTVNGARLDYMPALRSKAKVPVFTVFQHGVGTMLGKQIAALLPSGGNVLSIQGPTGNPVASKRAEYMMMALPHNIQVKALRGQLTEASAFQSVTNWLRLAIARADSIDLVACQVCDLAVGAKKAFKEKSNGAERERWLSLPFLGVGVAGQAKPLVDQGMLKAAVIIFPTMDRSIELLVRALERGSQPPEITVIDEVSYPALEVLAKKAVAAAARA